MSAILIARSGISLVVLSFCVSLSAAEPLAWKFAEGKSWQTETERTTTTVSTHPGSNSKIVSKTDITSKIVVNAVEGGTATVTETVSAIHATIEIDNSETVGGKKTDRLEKVEYDSANPNSPATTRAAKALKAKLEPLVGKSETYQVDARGQRIEFPSAPYGARPNTFGGVILPEAGASEDAAWTSPSITMSSPVAAKLDLTWKRESTEGDVMKLAGTGTVTSGEATTPWEKATYNATADFNTAIGALVSSETTFVVAMRKVVREKNIDATTTVKTTTTWKEIPSQ